VVLPEIDKLKPTVSKQVLQEMKEAGIRGEKKYLQEYHAKRSIEIVGSPKDFRRVIYCIIAQLTARRNQLFNEHNCRPLPSIIAPPLSQLPLFVVTTIALGRLSLDPTPFDSESFLTLTTLAHPDPTLTLPIILGVLTMANVESSNWVMNAAERERAQKFEEKNAKRIADGGKPNIEPKLLLKSVLRTLSVGRIILASITPGVTSPLVH
jgi:mitochondrial inner membrane protein COX18